jgi:hypothetical protein
MASLGHHAFGDYQSDLMQILQFQLNIYIM